MIPFFIYYSMFGFQRFGDLAWAAGDSRCPRLPARRHVRKNHTQWRRLQHEDGHSHVQSSLIPNCISYDATFAYEVAVTRCRRPAPHVPQQEEDVFYYLTLLNENYEHPMMPEGAQHGILKACISSQGTGEQRTARAASGLGRHPARSDRGRRTV